MQAPAVAAVVDALAQQPHAAQPGTINAETAQQQPPRQRLVPQSALKAQGSPGGSSAHAPVKGVQAEQLARAAAGEQQKPARQRPAAQAASSAQGAPGGWGVEAFDGEGEGGGGRGAVGAAAVCVPVCVGGAGPAAVAVVVAVAVAGLEAEAAAVAAALAVAVCMAVPVAADAEPVGVPLPVGGADAVANAVKEATAVTEGRAVEDAVAVAVGEPDGGAQRSAEALHAHPGAQRMALVVSAVQAGPRGAAGHHAALGAPHPGGARTAGGDAGEAKVNTACGAHAAREAPWQESSEGAHCRPSLHSVAARGAVGASTLVAFPARAPSHAAHAGAAAMPSDAAAPR